MLLNFDSVQKSSLQEQLRSHMSGITKSVMNSPCCDCQSGKSVNRALQDQNGRSNSFQNRRRGGGYRNNYNRNSNNNSWGRNRNRGYNNRGRNRGRNNYGRGGQSGGYQKNNYNRDYHNVPPPNQQQQGGYSNNSNRSSSNGKKGNPKIFIKGCRWVGKKLRLTISCYNSLIE